MKKILFAAVIFITAYQVSVAQDVKFGVTAGYLNAQAKASVENFDISDNASGFYVGGLIDLSLNESFHIVPGVNYGNLEESSFLFIPVMAQYLIADSGFFFQAGPQITLDLEDDPFELTDTFGLDAAFGAGYQINDNFFVEAKYSLEVTNRYNNDLDGIGDANLKLNTLFFGLGYKF